MSAAHKIVEGLRDAAAGNFDRVTIEGQVWVRLTPERAAAADLLAALERFMEIEDRCDLEDGDFPPDQCPRIKEDGVMCYQCEARAAIAKARDAPEPPA